MASRTEIQSHDNPVQFRQSGGNMGDDSTATRANRTRLSRLFYVDFGDSVFGNVDAPLRHNGAYYRVDGVVLFSKAG